MKNPTLPKKQSGVVLFVALILLLILSMIGVTVARMQTVEERMARNEHNHQLATQAAEAALRNAEALLGNAPVVGVFAQDTAGYYVVSQTTGSMIPTLNFGVPANVVAYSGPALSAVPVAVSTPRIAMELVGFGAVPGDPLPNPPATYRITVQGVDADGNPSVTLQTVYR
jgi:type IV pilus assembly protein PilX